MNKCRQLLVLIFVLFCFMPGYSQVAAKRLSAEIAAGTAHPLGRFANKEFSFADSSGLALTGWSGSLSLSYKFGKNTGVALLIGHSENKQSKDAYAEFNTKENGSGTLSRTVTNNWKLWKLLAGLFMELPISEKISFRPALYAGFCKTARPMAQSSFSYQAPGGAIVGSYTIGERPLDWAFCYQASMGLRALSRKNIYYTADIGLYNANPNYKLSYQPDPFGAPGVYTQIKKEYSLLSFTVQIGVGINF